jgi:hypothetical protein
MKYWVLIVSGMVSVSAYSQSATLISLKEEPYGYTGVIDSNAGANTGAAVLYIKFARTTVPLTNNQFRIDLRYPEVPAEILKTLKLPQVGVPFKCNLSAAAQVAGAKLVQVQPYEYAFRDFSANLDQADQQLLNFGTNADEDRICSVTFELSTPILTNNLGMMVTSGLPNLKVRTRDYLNKNFADIAGPYTRFLQSGSVDFNTDDEFWFLISAAVYQEPRLMNGFMNSDQTYIETWIKNFAYNIVNGAGSPWPYRKQLRHRFGELKDPPKTYVITTESKEVEYEL